jgi:hypothetical protein
MERSKEDKNKSTILEGDDFFEYSLSEENSASSGSK